MVVATATRSGRTTSARTVATRNKRQQSKALGDVSNDQGGAKKAKKATSKKTAPKKSANKRKAAGAANGKASSSSKPFEAFVDPELQTASEDDKKSNSKVLEESNTSDSSSEAPATEQAPAAVAPLGEAEGLAMKAAAQQLKDAPEDPTLQMLQRSESFAADPQMSPWYAQDIAKWYRKREREFEAPPNYMEVCERDINPQMRGILVDWLVEVSEMYNLADQTIYLCVNYIDRYVSRNVVPRNCLQLVGVTCLQIAAKYEEVSCPSGEQFSYISVTAVEEIMKTERKILLNLDFKLTVPTALDFCGHFCRVSHANATTTMLARYFLELTLQEYVFLGFQASAIAATAVKIALWYNDGTPWETSTGCGESHDSSLAEACGYTTEELRNCSATMATMLRNLNNTTLPAVREKYSHSKCLRVSLFQFENLVLEEEQEAGAVAAVGGLPAPMAMAI